MHEKINIGVLGCANIAYNKVLPALKESDIFNVIGVASRNKQKANTFAEKFNTKAYYSYQDLLDDSNLDAIYIPLPNSLHYEWILKALDRSLNILVEKSMACTYEQVVGLNDLAKKKNLVLMENFQFRFHSQLGYIQKILDEGVIGELRNVRSCFGFPPFSQKDNIRYNHKLGGGALLDAGAYPIKITQVFLGPDVYVASSSLAVPEGYEVDIWGSGYIKQKNGPLTSQISFGFDNYYQNSIELWGSKGKLSTNRIFTAPSTLAPILNIETSEEKKSIELPKDDHFIKMLYHFYDKIKRKENLDLEYNQNVSQARLINEVLKVRNI